MGVAMRASPPISMEEALRRVLDLVTPLDPEEVAIPTCLGQVLAEDLLPGLDVPTCDSASRDGFAVRAADAKAASQQHPIVLRIVGEANAAARTKETLLPGTVMRVMTGAPLPFGADCVLPVECTCDCKATSPTWWAPSGSVSIRITQPLQTGLNVRMAGADLAAGGCGLRRGTLLRPAHMAVIAALGRQSVQVIRRPAVALLATGDELIEPGDFQSPGRFYHLNGYAVGAQVLHYGGLPTLLGVAPDDMDILSTRLREGLTADFLISTGGTSQGKGDLVGQVLKEEEHVSLWDLAVESSKPVTFRVLREPKSGRRVPHLALPGYPVSAMVAFELFGRPLLLKLQGRTDLAPHTLLAISQDAIVNQRGRHLHVPVKLTSSAIGIEARLAHLPYTNMLVAWAEADGFAIVPPEVTCVPAGGPITVLIPGWAPVRTW